VGSGCCSGGGGASLGRLRSAIALLALFVWLGAPAGAETLAHAGVERSYLLHAPRGAEGPRPLFVLLHPGGSHAAQFRRQIELDAAAEAGGALVVYTVGRAGHWNDGRTRADGTLVNPGDDVGFVLALIDRLVAEGRADAASVHVAGHSNGGMLALRLACEQPGRFRSVAAVSASLPARLACPTGAAAVAVLLVHGTADPLLPFGGGAFAQPERDLGRVASAAETAAAFAKRNRCGTAETRPSNGASGTTIAAYRGCRAPLVHVVATGAGHGWPGSSYGPRMVRQLGPTGSFAATRALLGFALEGRTPD
jgi:polyhydroxybutyrate depolymerase